MLQNKLGYEIKYFLNEWGFDWGDGQTDISFCPFCGTELSNHKEGILKDIEIALKGELNNVMSDSRPLDWKSLEQRHKDIINYLRENLK